MNTLIDPAAATHGQRELLRAGTTPPRRIVAALMLGLACFTTIGCEVKTDPRIVLSRTRLLLDQAPNDAISIEQAKTQMAADASNNTVTIKGHADLNAYASIADGKALMLIREISTDEHGQDSGHDPSTCPFCKRKMESAPRAVVEFVDRDGKVLPFSPAILFEIKQYDLVVIQGQAKLDAELDILKITANGIFASR